MNARSRSFQFRFRFVLILGALGLGGGTDNSPPSGEPVWVTGWGADDLKRDQGKPISQKMILVGKDPNFDSAVVWDGKTRLTVRWSDISRPDKPRPAPVAEPKVESGDACKLPTPGAIHAFVQATDQAATTGSAVQQPAVCSVWR